MFNKKEIKRIEALEREMKVGFDSLLKALEEPRCFRKGDLVPENTVLSDVVKLLLAIKDYLKINIHQEKEN